MRTWIKISNDLASLDELLGHSNYACGAYGVTCDFCKARGYYVEAWYNAVYESDVYDRPQKVALCKQCATPALESLAITNIREKK